MESLAPEPVSGLTGPIALPANPQASAICVHHGGRTFQTTFNQASVFVRRVHHLVDTGGAELVPLLHADGVELLHISAQTPLQIHDVRDHSLDGAHRNRT